MVDGILMLLVMATAVSFARFGYAMFQFPRYLRLTHPATYRRLMHGWEGPALVYHTAEMGAFLWKSDEDLGDPTVRHLRGQVRRSLRYMAVCAGLLVLLGFPLIVLTHLPR